jgi:hypothetical protein
MRYQLRHTPNTFFIHNQTSSPALSAIAFAKAEFNLPLNYAAGISYPQNEPQKYN